MLTLAIHELATNALKYGALSHEHGRLDVTWEVTPEEDASWLRLIWVETKAAVPLMEPARQGFGTTLIEQRIH